MKEVEPSTLTGLLIALYEREKLREIPEGMFSITRDWLEHILALREHPSEKPTKLLLVNDVPARDMKKNSPPKAA